SHTAGSASSRRSCVEPFRFSSRRKGAPSPAGRKLCTRLLRRKGEEQQHERQQLRGRRAGVERAGAAEAVVAGARQRAAGSIAEAEDNGGEERLSGGAQPGGNGA